MDILPFKKILCPTDFSEASSEALNAATELAVRFSSELVLLHAVHPLAVVPRAYPTYFDVPRYQQEMEEYARKQLQELVTENTTQQITVRQKVVVGEAAESIVSAAEDESVDLVVISTHGERGWKKLMLGSVAEKVVRFCPRPVLVIRKRPEEG